MLCLITGAHLGQFVDWNLQERPNFVLISGIMRLLVAQYGVLSKTWNACKKVYVSVNCEMNHKDEKKDCFTAPVKILPGEIIRSPRFLRSNYFS